MTRIAGMAGNRGRNLLNIADRAPAGAEFSVILSNNEDAPVLAAAAERGIPTGVVERAEDESRESHERRILDRLAGYDIDLVCLDGYMRILTDEFLDSVPLTLNVHPSLLPSFKGTDAWSNALAAGVTVTGCTVHVVTEEVDGGPIVTQEPVPVYENDTVEALKERVLYDGEFVAYPRAVGAVAEDRVTIDGDTVRIDGDEDESGAFPVRRIDTGERAASLRYGENPHQDAALYADVTHEASVVHADQLNEGAKALSYNNYNDADGALNLIKEFEEPAAAVIKHTNPAGCARADTLAEAYADALATDPQSAFGGIVALNRECDTATAEQIIDSFKEIVVAPGYTDAALDVLRSKDNLRVLDVGLSYERTERFVEKPLVGGRLVQERDRQQLTSDDLEFVTEREPDEQVETMLFAWSVAKHVKSNAIVFAADTETVGIGMGQVSRVDAVRLAGLKADEHAQGKSADGAVMASDAFFPFPDGIERAAEHGVEAVVQPGGSVNDEEVIAAANELDMTMAFTEQRCFKHD